MHAGKIARSNAATFVPPTHNSLATRLQGKQAFHNPGRLSPLMMRRASQRRAATLQQMQFQEEVDPAAAFEGGGSSLSPALQAKYANLLAGNVDLGRVKVYTGQRVDAVLSSSGLEGLTDGKNVAVSSQAGRGTLEHELGHVAQQQQPGFNLNEGSREGYERDADVIADSLIMGRAVNSGSTVADSSFQAKTSEAYQGKCKKCESEGAQKQQFKEVKQGDASKRGRGGAEVPTWKKFAQCLFTGGSSIGILAPAALSGLRDKAPAIGRLIAAGNAARAVSIAKGLLAATNFVGWTALAAVIYACAEEYYGDANAEAVQRAIDATEPIRNEIETCLEQGGDPLLCSAPGVRF